MRSLDSRLRPLAFLGMVVLLGATFASAAFAGPYTKLQVLMPGETAAPGTPSGKTGTASAQTSGVPFQVTVRACDDTWATVAGNTHTIQIQSSDASATLPIPAQLVNGTGSFTVRFNAGGAFTVIAHDQTDPTIPDATSAPVQSLVLQGFVFSTISQKHFTAGAPENMTLRAVDPQGNTVTGFQGVVRLKETTSFGDGRAAPDSITLVNGAWTGGIAALRADETNINRGNCNFYAWLASAENKNGTSDPFVVHPAAFSRVQIVAPGETPLPGSATGKSGTPSSQSAGQAFAVGAWSTDAYWNPVTSADNVRITSSDGAASTPVSGALTNGFRSFNVTLNTVGTQTLTVADLTNGSIQGMTSPGIAVQPNSVHHFVIAPVVSPQVAGVPVAVTIRATDASGNTIPGFAGDVNLAANTGAGSMTPERITISNGLWAGNLTFKGAGNAVLFTASDFAAPPHTGASNSFIVSPGPLAGLQVLLPGESAASGDPDGRIGTPATQSAGNAFNLVVRAVDAYWNVVPGISHRVGFASTDSFAIMPSDTTLADGQRIVPVRLHKSGSQTITVTDLDAPISSDTSSPVTIVGGPFARVLILAPGEFVAPGTASGRAGTATDQSIHYAFTVTVLATDNWWNPVAGVDDVVRITSNDLLAVLPGDTALVNGRIDAPVRLKAGGYSLISVADVTNPSKTGSSTQVNAISSGFHLEASVAQDSARAGENFSLTVKVTNDAGSVIQEINSLVTLSVIRASSSPTQPGRGQLTPVTVQLLQGQCTLNAQYTFAEAIQIVANDNAGNAPATTLPIVIKPGVPARIEFTSSPMWVGGNKVASLTARLEDLYDNGVPNAPMTFAVITGNGTLTSFDSSTDATGVARAQFLSPRQPEKDLLRATSGGLNQDLLLETAFVDPGAPGGHVTNYPNPFHPPVQGTTLAWKLDDDATVRLRIFTMSGDLVLDRTFASGGTGGVAGLNEWVWDGSNGSGRTVSSGGYLALLEAQGTGETMHIMRRKIAVVR